MKRYNITKFYDWSSHFIFKYRPINASCVNWFCKCLSNTNFGLRFITYVLAFLSITACSVGNNGDKTDPVVVEQPIAFIKRPLTDADGDIIATNLEDPAQFRPGAVLYLKESATPNGSIKDISSAAFSGPGFLNDDGELLYDVKDLHVSFDGKKLLFSMRAPEIEDADEEDQPKWNIWEYDIETSSLQRLITSTISAEEGHDISPAYLPGGSIVFSSTRQRRSKAILLDEGKTQFSGLDEDRNTEAFVLHIMNAGGDSIQQLTFNQSHDLYPLVLDNGKILFSRWDNAGQTRSNGYNLYEINPDGTGLNYQYGRHSHDSGSARSQVQFAYPRQLENGNIAVQLREVRNENLSSQPTEINIKDYVEHDVQINGTVEDLDVESGGQTPIIKGLNTSDTQTLNGSFSAFFPLSDGSNRYLVSWSVCRIQLIDTNANEAGNQTGAVEFCTQEKLDSPLYEGANPLYGLWIYNANDNTQLPIDLSESGFVFDEAVIMKSRSIPDTYVSDSSLVDETLLSAGLGAIHIRSVYDFDGIDRSPSGIDALVQSTPSERPQRFIRIEKPASIPNDDVKEVPNSAYGIATNQLMREILGYAPIEPDGSVNVAIPANVPFAISILDKDGKRTSQRHQNWLQVAPGETIECIGCHTANSQVPHGRTDAQPFSINTGELSNKVPFPVVEIATTQDSIDGQIQDALNDVFVDTMAETFTKRNGAVRKLTPDLIFDDEWNTSAPDPNDSPFLDYAYTNLESSVPIFKDTCLTDWKVFCRIVINYKDHIHPFWSIDRRILDPDAEEDEENVLEDRTCTSCHTTVDPDSVSKLKIPDAHLDLTDGTSTGNPDHLKSYRELLVNDVEREIIGNSEDGFAFIVRLVDSGLTEDGILEDSEGNPILDENGDEITIQVPIFVNVPALASMSTNGALASSTFMEIFETGGLHEGYLSKAELKLIAEWLDLGAQYFNNPLAEF